MIRWALQYLRDRHAADMDLYRAHHADSRNQILHRFMIPLETFSFLLAFASLLESLGDGGGNRNSAVDPSVNFLILVSCIGWTVGLISLLIAPAESRWAGVASLVFHVASSRLVRRFFTDTATADLQLRPKQRIGDRNATVRRMSSRPLLFVSVGLWVFAWLMQVVVGHWLWEGNQPNVANVSEVSWLAMTQSVLIAWSA